MDKSKRALSKALGIAGTSAIAWKKPVVDSLVLPVHAVTTGCFGCFSSGSHSYFVPLGTSAGLVNLVFHEDTTDCDNPSGEDISVFAGSESEAQNILDAYCAPDTGALGANGYYLDGDVDNSCGVVFSGTDCV